MSEDIQVPPPCTMQTFGAQPESMRSDIMRMDKGTGIWVDGNPGMQNYQPRRLPDDDKVRRVPLRLYWFGGIVQIAWMYYNGRQELEYTDWTVLDEGTRQDATGKVKITDDDRTIAWIKDYPRRCIPHLDCLQLQREYPLHFPWFTGASLLPGDVEIVACQNISTADRGIPETLHNSES